MAINNQLNKLNENELSYEAQNTVVGQADIPSLSARDMQMSVERLGRNYLMPAINIIIDTINQTYSRSETETAIDKKVTEIGAGDMARAVYDQGGTVANAGGIVAYIDTAYKTFRDFIAASRVATVNLLANGWSESAPYYQTVSVDWMTDVWKPDVPVLDNPDADGALDAFGNITKIQSNNGSLTFYCAHARPNVSLAVTVSGIYMGGQ